MDERWDKRQETIAYSQRSEMKERKVDSFQKMTANKFLLQEMDDGVGCLEIQKVLEQEGFEDAWTRRWAPEVIN